MKKKIEPRLETLYRLPNHRWTNLEIAKLYKAKNVLRQTKFNALVREHDLNQAIRYSYSKKFCGENHPNETWKPMDLHVWGNTTIGILGQKAKDGNSDAAEELWRLAVQATGLLTQICKTKPELLRSVARINRQWPVFKRVDAKLTTEERKIFDAIQLGYGDFIEFRTGKAKWKLDDDAGKFAHSLLYYIRAARNDDGTRYGKISELAREKLQYNFDDQSCEEWWTFAKEILLSVYPKPHMVDELKNLTPATEAGRKKSPGVIDQDIFRVLKNRFKAFAP